MPNHKDLIVESFIRVHQEEHPLENAHGKVQREKGAYAHQRQQNKRRWQQYLQVLLDVDPETVAAEYDRLIAADAAAAQELGNARAHKSRLRILSDPRGLD